MIKPDTRSPSLVRGISLNEEINDMLKALSDYYNANASAVVRALIEQEYLSVAEKIASETKEEPSNG